MLQSFDFRVLREAQLQAADVARGALFEEGTDLAAIANEADAGIAVPEFHLVTQERVEAAHAAGIAVYTWTADEPADWRALVEAGVDAIITNDPAGLLTYLGRGSR
jgi:glycerophosphoryl diester phosphodiesterase